MLKRATDLAIKLNWLVLLLPYSHLKPFIVNWNVVNDARTFCNDEPENLYHLFYECPHSKTFWTDFESDWYHLSNQPIHLSAQNVLFGVLSKQCPLSNLLNYFIVIGKIIFCGTAEEAKHFLKFKDCNGNLTLNMKQKKIWTRKTSLKRNGCSLQYKYLCPSRFNAFLF